MSTILDTEEFNRFYEEGIGYENLIIKYLSQVLPSDIKVIRRENPYSKFDVYLECGQKTLRLEIESTITDTMRGWTNKIPSASWWKRGLTVPKRKIDDIGFDIYIKFSRTLQSFYAIDKNYLIKSCLDDVCKNSSSHVKKNNDFFVRLPWELTKNNNVVMDNMDNFVKLVRRLSK